MIIKHAFDDRRYDNRRSKRRVAVDRAAQPKIRRRGAALLDCRAALFTPVGCRFDERWLRTTGTEQKAAASVNSLWAHGEACCGDAGGGGTARRIAAAGDTSDIREPTLGPGPSEWRVEPDDTSPYDSRPDDRYPHDRPPKSRLIGDGGAARGDDFFPPRDDADATADYAPPDIRAGTPRRIPPVGVFILGGIVAAAGVFAFAYITPRNSLDELRTPAASVAIRPDDPARAAFSVTDPSSIQPAERLVRPTAEPANDIAVDPAMVHEPRDPYAATPAVPSALPSSPPPAGPIPGRLSVPVLGNPVAKPAPLKTAESTQRATSARGDQSPLQRGDAPSFDAAAPSPPANSAVAAAPPNVEAPTRQSPQPGIASAPTEVAKFVQCADFFHQNRPGGSGYRGPPVARCGRYHVPIVVAAPSDKRNGNR